MEATVVDGDFAYASWPRRILSALIDSFAISLLSSPIAGPAVGRFFEAVSEETEVSAADLRTIVLTNLFVSVAYMTALHSWRGSTLGKMAARTVLVRDDGRAVSVGVAFVRAVTVAAIQFVSSWLLLPIILDEVWPLWNRRRQTIHDLVAKTIVVRASSVQPVTQNLTD